MSKGYVGLASASAVYKNIYIRNIRHTPKNIYQSPKIFPICALTLRKDPKMHRNDPPKKSSFLKTPKNIEIQNIEPQKTYL